MRNRIRHFCFDRKRSWISHPLGRLNAVHSQFWTAIKFDGAYWTQWDMRNDLVSNASIPFTIVLLLRINRPHPCATSILNVCRAHVRNASIKNQASVCVENRNAAAFYTLAYGFRLHFTFSWSNMRVENWIIAWHRTMHMDGVRREERGNLIDSFLWT